MRRILIGIAGAVVCAALFLSPGAGAAPKPLKQAEKLAGNFDKLEEARAKVAEAFADSALSTDAHALFVAGKVEEGAFRHYYKLLGINRNDPKVDRTLMADALLSALSYYERALAVDTVTDKKGKRTTHYSARIAEWLNAVTPSLYNAGVAYMNKRMYYPQAYSAFKAYALAPTKYYYNEGENVMTDSVQANAWFYAGVMAYNAGQYVPAAESFGIARRLGYPRKEVLLNEMSCLSFIIKESPASNDSLSRQLTRLAGIGHERFGLREPLFIKKYVAGLVMENRLDSALSVVDATLASDSVAMLHAMKGALLYTMGRHSEAAREYLVAAADSAADFTTLKEASKAVAGEGISLLSQVKGNKKAARERREEIRNTYLSPALEFATRAAAIYPDDPDVANTIETIRYYMH